MNKRWSQEEIDFLVKNRSFSDQRVVVELRRNFPKSRCSFTLWGVKKKRQRLGIKK